MPYVDLAGLSRFAGKSKDFASSACAGLDMANWQRTAAAGAVSFLPVPEMPLDPVVNFLFNETGPASGTKGPDNPSTITGVTQAKVTRCGKNLIALPYGMGSTTISDVSFAVNNDYSITVSGTASADAYFYIAFAAGSPWLVSGLTYTLSGCPSGGSSSTYYMRHRGYTEAGQIDTGSGGVFIANATGRTDNICIVIKSGTTVSNLVFKPQLELGSVATSFEPYEGADYTVNLGGTFYGGSVDFSTGVMTVTWGLYTFTGNEGWVLSSASELINSFRADILPSGTFSASISASTRACSHFPLDNAQTPAVNTFTTWGASNAWVYFRVPTASYSDADSFKSWLASEYALDHPVMLAYKLNTPTTLPLNPTQLYSLSQADPYTPRINTGYSDQVSVQVGYPKSPQASQTELTNAIVSLGGNV